LLFQGDKLTDCYVKYQHCWDLENNKNYDRKEIAKKLIEGIFLKKTLFILFL
jgi:hypothetical protein